MEIQFYSNKSDPRQVRKDIDLVKTVEFNTWETLEILNINILLDYDVDLINCNYCFIPLLDRYYFIDSAEIEEGNFLRIKGSVDVLYTFSGDILANGGIIKRQANNFNLYLNDDQTQVYSDMGTVTKVFPNSPLNVAEQTDFILKVVG